MKDLTTLDDIIMHALNTKRAGLLHPQQILVFKLSKEEREKVYNDMLDYEIDYEHIQLENYQGHYQFVLFGIQFNVF